MKFSIRQLLLIPVIFLATTFLVASFIPNGSSSWMHEVNSVQSAQSWVDTSIRYCDSEYLDEITINSWLAKQLPSTNPAFDSLGHSPNFDSWGNPYRIRMPKKPNDQFLVYSMGKDGKSNTQGDDGDDIRSWDANRGTWYANRQFKYEISACMICSGILTAVCFWLSTLLYVKQ